MVAAKINSKNFRTRLKVKNLTVSGLARRIQRSRQAIYFAVENPRRYSPTYALIEEALT